MILVRFHCTPNLDFKPFFLITPLIIFKIRNRVSRKEIILDSVYNSSESISGFENGKIKR